MEGLITLKNTLLTTRVIFLLRATTKANEFKTQIRTPIIMQRITSSTTTTIHLPSQKNLFERRHKMFVFNANNWVTTKENVLS